eukprot:g26869.t1
MENACLHVSILLRLLHSEKFISLIVEDVSLQLFLLNGVSPLQDSEQIDLTSAPSFLLVAGEAAPPPRTDELMATINQTCQDAGGIYAKYGCKAISWDDCTRSAGPKGLSCFGPNITDSRLVERSGKTLYTVRGSNWNERLGKVAAKDDGTVEFCGEAYNYQTVSNDDPKNLVLLCTSEGTFVQQQGVGFQKLFLHETTEASEQIARCWMEAKRTGHRERVDQLKMQVAQLDAEATERKLRAAEAEEATLEGKAVARRFGIDAMGSRCNMLMTIQAKLCTPEEIATVLLKDVKKVVTDYLGDAKKQLGCVITVPAHATDAQRQATKIINEPAAASIAHGLDKMSDAERKVIVVDVGAGTTDVSLLEIDSGIFETLAAFYDTVTPRILATNGAQLGGSDFDEALMATVKHQHQSRTPCELQEACEAELIRPTIQQVEELILATLRDGKVDVKEIDEVLLVGGSAKEPCDTVHNCEDAVVIGAAYQAAILCGKNSAATDLLLLDVTPLSIGFESANGAMTRVIDTLLFMCNLV